MSYDPIATYTRRFHIIQCMVAPVESKFTSHMVKGTVKSRRNAWSGEYPTKSLSESLQTLCNGWF